MLARVSRIMEGFKLQITSKVPGGGKYHNVEVCDMSGNFSRNVSTINYMFPVPVAMLHNEENSMTCLAPFCPCIPDKTDIQCSSIIIKTHEFNLKK